MNIYGYCRCGERVERRDYPEHVLVCPSHEDGDTEPICSECADDPRICGCPDKRAC